MEAKERHYQIATMFFDDYISTIKLDVCVIDENELDRLAGKIEVSSKELEAVISLACDRIDRKVSPILIDKDKELEIIKKVLKLDFKKNSVIVKNGHNSFRTLAREINHTNFGEPVSIAELKEFLKPFFVEIVEETFS